MSKDHQICVMCPAIIGLTSISHPYIMLYVDSFTIDDLSVYDKPKHKVILLLIILLKLY